MAVTVEKLELLYEAVVFGQELKTAILNEMGFNSNHLNELIENGILKREKKGTYIFTDVENLYFYGKKLLSLKRNDDANKCFEKCYRLNSNHKGACFQLFLRSIDKKDYIKAFEYFDIFFETDNPFYNSDANLYLYLLNLITNIPEKHKAYVRCMQFGNIMVKKDDKRFNDICLQNRIRTAIFNGKYAYALNQMGSSFDEHDSKKVQTIIIRKLVYQAIIIENQNKAELFRLVNEQNYEGVLAFLKEKQVRQNLNLSDKYSMKLAFAIIEMKKTNKIPKINFTETTDWCAAIDNCNYGLAKKLTADFCQKHNLSVEQNIIFILLTKLCDLLLSLKEPYKAKDTNLTKSVRTLPKTELKFYDVIKCLMDNDVDSALSVLKEYLQYINNLDYEFLIVDLIRLSLLEQDVSFSKPTTVLAYISKGHFLFNLNDYIQAFYEMFFQGKFEEAHIYLDIITKAKSIGCDCNQLEIFSQALAFAERTSCQNKNISTITLNPIKFEPQILTESKKQPKNVVKIAKETPDIPITFSSRNTYVETRNSEEENIENMRKIISDAVDKLIKGQGIVLLKPMNESKIKGFYKLLMEYPDIRCFAIKSEGKEQLVLRYNEHKMVNPSKLIALGNAAYDLKKYSECIENYLQLLQLNEPKAFIYSKLGISYLKMKNIAAAIDYMTVATRLDSDEKNHCDFSEMLLYLKGEVIDRKPRFRMSLEEFEYDLENGNINDLNQITQDILTSGLDIDSACEQLGMIPEEIDTLKLAYAKEYYSQEDFASGDALVKAVERSKNKTPYTISLLAEIRKNRNFYVNRRDPDSPRLELGLKSRKNVQPK